MGNRLHGTDLLKNPHLVRRSPALDYLRVRVELRDLHAPDLDLLPGSADAVERTFVCPCDRVRKGHIVLIGDHVLHGNLEIRKGGVELREPSDEASGPEPWSSAGS